MRVSIALLSLFGWLLYVGQLISVVNFPLAQRHGLQEPPEQTDPLYSRLELYAARWDVLCLWILPLTGVLILLEHPWWPYAALIGGAIFVDAGGRETAKVLGLRKEGVRSGSSRQFWLAMAVYGYFMVTGMLAVATGLDAAA